CLRRYVRAAPGCQRWCNSPWISFVPFLALGFFVGLLGRRGFRGGFGDGLSAFFSGLFRSCRGSVGVSGRGVGRLVSSLLGLVGLEQFPLPLGERFRLGPLGRGTGGAGHEAFGDGVGDYSGEQRDGADRVVVARDRVVDLIRVAVGVEDGDDGDTKLACLGDGEVLLL